MKAFFVIERHVNGDVYSIYGSLGRTWDDATECDVNYSFASQEDAEDAAMREYIASQHAGADYARHTFELLVIEHTRYALRSALHIAEAIED